MRHDPASSSVHFEPLHPASRSAVIVGVVVGPLLWLVAIAAVAWFFEYTWAIGLGVLVTGTTFLVALIALVLLRAARVRQEQRYVDTG
jgi:hypothetical protein